MSSTILDSHCLGLYILTEIELRARDSKIRPWGLESFSHSMQPLSGFSGTCQIETIHHQEAWISID